MFHPQTQKYFTCLLPALLLIFTNTGYSFQPSLSNSILSSGKWIKIEVSERGIYRITKQDLLNSGFSSAGIVPSKIRLFGNGGKVILQKISDPRPEDLIENAIYITGSNDGTFDTSDVILFFADGPDELRYDQSNKLQYSRNPYSNSSYYFLTISDNDGKRIESRINEGGSFTLIDYYHDLKSHEVDEHNILQALITSYGGSGREWYGERFKENLNQSVSFNIDNLFDAGNSTLITSLLGVSKTSSSFQTKINNILLGDQPITAIPDSRYGVKGQARIDTFLISNSLLGQIQNAEIQLQYFPGNAIEDAGYLNYLILAAERKLIKGAGSLIFQNLLTNVSGSHTYTIQNLQTPDIIWDITNPKSPVLQEIDFTGDTGMFGITTDSLHRFIAFNSLLDVRSPDSFTSVPNQNLRSLQTPKLLIITNETFMPEGERLAVFRQSNDGIASEVVLATKIFNEFGSGSPDPTAIRDFVKFLYDKSPDLKYLLLFGRTSYDPKDRISNNTNFVPTYVSRNSLDPLRSYTSDDYFGFLESNEGEWIENTSGDHTVEIGIGRLPVKTAAEAKVVVDKIIKYSSDENFQGKYRNDVYFVGDFGDANYHLDQSDRLATMVDTSYVDFNSHRFFLDNFELLQQPGKNSFPDASKKLTEIVNQGALIINYTGHGGEEGLSNEFLLRIPDLDKWKNPERLPLLVTATCEFGRHDDPFRVSAGELTLTNPNGGSIALVTTARPVFASTNFELNKAFYGRVFKKENNQNPRLGDVFMETKNKSLTGPNNRNFSLLGDPSMRLAYPKNNLVIQSINAQPVEFADTLSMLSTVTIDGIITDPNGMELTNYDGTLFVKVLDKVTDLQTLGQDTQPFVYKAREGIIFSGLSSIVQGKFHFEFILPEDVGFQIGSAKVTMYAQSENTLDDANGSSLKLIVGGENLTPEVDVTPPSIDLYMEDISFREGGVTGSNTILLAGIEDASGINLLPGQNELIAILDDETELALSEYYEADKDSYMNGWVVLPIDNLDKGFHTIKVYASDVYNNQSVATINFRVENERRLKIENLINYPNPVFDKTTFKFNHNRSGDNLYIQISIISMSGEIVQNLEWQIDNAPTTIDNLTWGDGNFSGKNLTPGVYVGRLLVRSRIDGAKNQAFRRLLIIK